jgi:hypothetical protein
MVWRQDVSDLIALNIVDSGFTTKMARSVDVEGSNGEAWVPASVRGLVVMIVACQVMDPGSIPGERKLFLMEESKRNEKK